MRGSPLRSSPLLPVRSRPRGPLLWAEPKRTHTRRTQPITLH